MLFTGFIALQKRKLGKFSSDHQKKKKKEKKKKKQTQNNKKEKIESAYKRDSIGEWTRTRRGKGIRCAIRHLRTAVWGIFSAGQQVGKARLKINNSFWLEFVIGSRGDVGTGNKKRNLKGGEIFIVMEDKSNKSVSDRGTAERATEDEERDKKEKKYV